MKKYNPLLIFLILTLNLTLYTLGGNCQSDIFNHPEVKWQTIETEHFKIFADSNLLGVAKDVAQIAEEIFPWVTKDLGYVPNFKVPIELIDYDEVSNGSAEPLFGKIVIYCSNSMVEMSGGNLPWFRRVIAHEFSHIITFGAIGAFDSFGKKYEVLGALQVIPIWFLEGIAQYEGETWDTHRDMFVRMTTLEGNLLPLFKMDGFAGTDARESRLIYEEGYSLIRYISSNYGRDKIKEILSELKKNPFVLSAAIEKVLGKRLDTIYEDWFSSIKEKYTGVKRQTLPYYDFASRLTTNMGIWVWHPIFSPDGKKVLFASSYEYDYAICDLYIGELKDNRLVNIKKIAERVGFFHSFSPSGDKILFSKMDYRKNGSLVEDIYIIDTTGKNCKRLTYNERAKCPSFSPDGKKIAYVVNKFGTTNIWVMDADGKNKVQLTKGENYEQNDSPRWSKDSRFIAFSHFSNEKRDIAIFDLKTKRFVKLTDDEFEDRTPVFMPDGKGILFTSDRIKGISNLFLMKIEEDDSGIPSPGEITQLTDILGGVFEPEIDNTGNRIVFSGFGATGFDIYLCELNRLFPVKIDNQALKLSLPDTNSKIVAESLPLNISPPHSYNSFLEIRPIFLLPAITISNYGLWGTIAMYFLDPLEKHTIYGYGYFDGFDAVYSWYYINRQLYPTIVFSGYQDQYYYLGEGVYRRYRGTSIEAQFPLSEHLSLSFSTLFQTGEYTSFDTEGYKIGEIDENENNFGIDCLYSTYKERVDSDFNPAAGRLIDFSYAWSNPAIGSNYNYSLYKVDWREYIDISRKLSHTLALRAYAGLIDTPQDLIISIPWDDNTLRGISWGALRGDRNLALSLEYRFPLFKDLGLNLLGFYFDRFYIVPFADYGKAWYGNEIASGGSRSTFGVEARFRAWVMSRYQIILRFGLLQEIGNNNQLGWLFSIQPTF